MYYIVFIELFVFTLISFFYDKKDFLYKILMISLTLLLCFRYGQGSDYFSYEYCYSTMTTFENAINNSSKINSEIGFRLICALFYELQFSFTEFVFCLSLFDMVLLHRFISKYSKNRVFSLLLFFPTFYLTYYFSGIRQGLTIALFIGVLYELIEKKQWMKYIIGCVLISTIHTAALVLIIVPFILEFKLEIIGAIKYPAFIVGIVLATGCLNGLLARIPVIGSKMMPYLDSSISILALLERIVSYTMILILYHHSSRKRSKRVQNFMKIYSVGIIIYLVFLPFSLISSRVIVYFKVLEVVIVPLLCDKANKFKTVAITFFVLLSVLMFFKNLNSYAEQGSYHPNINAFNYPYISVFEKEEIWNYRDYSPYFDLLRSK